MFSSPVMEKGGPESQESSSGSGSQWRSMFTSPVRERGGPESQENKNHVGE